MMDEIRFLAATGALGAGVHEPSIMRAVAEFKPHFIAADAGSTDAGPFALGAGVAAFSREQVMRDLETALAAGQSGKIPVLIGSVGTAGADVHVDWTLDIVREIAVRRCWSLRVASIRSEQSKDYLLDLWNDGRIKALDPAPNINIETIKGASRIVGMMGVEPLQSALSQDVDLIIAGRCSDPALYAAMPIMQGFPAGFAWHAGKVAECGTLACETMGKGVITAIVRQEEMIIGVVGDGLRCTPQSIAAHSLYENGDPYLHRECSGTLDLSESKYEQMADGKSVRVTGSAFREVAEYTVKLEGAALAGYQTIMIGGIRDPFIIGQLDTWLAKIKEHIHRSIADILKCEVTRDDYTLNFAVYGRNAVMGPREPSFDAIPHEVGILVEATAPTQAVATKIVKLARQPLLHAPIPEWKGAITGFACRHNPAEIERGAVWRFVLNHVAIPHNELEMFRHEILQIGENVECVV